MAEEEATSYSSETVEMTEEAPATCANCGKEERGDALLKTCSACMLVNYCGRDCQIAHRPEHENECKKRAAELLHDEALFRQPPIGDDCPICFLLLPEMPSAQVFMTCCGKTICSGCSFEYKLRSNGCPTCPFCRTNEPSAKQYAKMLRKRVDGNDANAICLFGITSY
jgi:hypothetical protein